MRHIAGIKVKDQGLFADMDIRGLGKINVVTGKNNSGKSRLLQNLGSPTGDIKLGGRFDEGVQRGVFQGLFKSLGHSFRDKFDKGKERTIERVMAAYDDGVVYDDQMQGFINFFRREFFESVGAGGGHYELPEGISGLLQRVKCPGVDVFRLGESRSYSSTSVLNDGTITMVLQSDQLLDRLSYMASKMPTSNERALYDKLMEAFKYITNGTRFFVDRLERNNILLRFGTSDASMHHADQCGLGLRDLLLMLYVIFTTDEHLLIIEEPETHLHPEMQRRLMDVMHENRSGQVFLSTHSNVIMSHRSVDAVLLCQYYDGRIHVTNESNLCAVYLSLGYSVSENIASDVVVLVEGPSDVEAYKEILAKCGVHKQVAVQVFPLGGDAMYPEQIDVFRERFKVLVVLDLDPGSSRRRGIMVRACAERKVPCVRLKRYAIENYVPKRCIRSEFPQHKDDVALAGDGCLLPDKKVEAQISFSIKGRLLNLFRRMTREDIMGTDLRSVVDETVKLAEAVVSSRPPRDSQVKL